MTYYANPNYIKYDEWFDNDIDPLDLKYYSDEKKFIDSVHEKFYQLSNHKLLIGTSNLYIEEKGK